MIDTLLLVLKSPENIVCSLIGFFGGVTFSPMIRPFFEKLFYHLNFINGEKQSIPNVKDDNRKTVRCIICASSLKFIGNEKKADMFGSTEYICLECTSCKYPVKFMKWEFEEMTKRFNQ